MDRMTYEEMLDNPQLAKIQRKLLGIMIEKRTNLCVAADVDTFKECVRLVHAVGPHICVLKVHTEIFGGNIEANLKQLYKLKKEYNFMLFQDRKFYDGSATVMRQYAGTYVKYCDLVTVVPILGDGIFDAISNAISGAELETDESRGCLAVCELSFSGVVPIDPEILYQFAKMNHPVCVGIIAQKFQMGSAPSLLKFTPGVHLEKSSDGSNQQWRQPKDVIEDGADVIIVGRGITATDEDLWGILAEQYKERLYNDYLEVVEQAQCYRKAKQAKFEPKIEPKIEPEAAPKVEPKAEPEVVPKAEPEVVPKAEPEVVPIAEPMVEPKVEKDT